MESSSVDYRVVLIAKNTMKVCVSPLAPGYAKTNGAAPCLVTGPRYLHVQGFCDSRALNILISDGNQELALGNVQQDPQQKYRFQWIFFLP